MDTPKPSLPLPGTYNKRSTLTTAALFVVSSLLIIASIRFLYSIRERSIIKDVNEELSTIADLKTHQIIQWRKERMADAAVIASNLFVKMTLGRATGPVSNLEESGKRLGVRLAEMVNIKGYRSAAIVDTAGRTVIGTAGFDSICNLLSIRKVLDSAVIYKRTTMTDLHSRKETGDFVHLSVFSPVISENDSAVSFLVVLEIDPHDFFGKIIQKWPVPSVSGELLIVRKDGEKTIFLNGPQYGDSVFSSLLLSSVNKIVSGSEHFSPSRYISIKDPYRRYGEVLAAVRPVARTNWYTVAKIDKKEALAELHDVNVRSTVLTFFLIFLTGILLALYHRHRSSRLYKRLYSMEKEKNALAQSLSSSERIFKSLFESMTEGVALNEMVFDNAGKPYNYRIISVNPAFERHTGVSSSTAVGKPVTEIFGIHEAPFLKEFAEVASTGTPVRLETFFPSLNKHFMLSVFSPEKNRVAVVFDDVTEELKAEERIKAQRDLFGNYLNIVESIIVALDAVGRITLINRKGCRLLGWNEEELIGKNWFETCLPPPMGMESVYPVFKKLMSGEIGHLEYFENPVITKDGTIRHIAWHNTVLRDNEGKITGTLSSGEDITERKKMEQALINEKERLAVTLRSIGDAVIATDVEGRIALMNKVAETLTGWNFEEARNKNLSDVFVIVNEFTRIPCENPVQRVLKSGETVQLENHTMLISRDGKEYIIADSGSPIRNRDGKIIGVVLVFRDNTEKQRVRDAIQKAQQLESLGVLAGGIAHDFNNLLGGIFGYLDLARSSIKSDKTAADYMNRALSVFGRAKDLTNQLLTFAKGGAPVKKALSLKPIIRDVVNFALSGSSIKPAFEISDDLLPCDIDENQISQVLENIVINARDAMPFGGTVNIMAENLPPAISPSPTLPSGTYVHISIQDHGTGISPEHLPHIFDPFFTTKQKGSGLGLAVSYSIIRRHDGIIEAESQTGKGSTFHIYLPVSSKTDVSDHNKRKTLMHRGSGRVLIMDDEDYIREIGFHLLKNMGYDADTAANGQ